MFKSTDGGDTWLDITDTTFTSASIGCITVAPSDPNVIYVGTGETDIRGNISVGDGMYRSTDAGKTWKNIGLNNGQMFADIIVHPDNPDWVMTWTVREMKASLMKMVLTTSALMKAVTTIPMVLTIRTDLETDLTIRTDSAMVLTIPMDSETVSTIRTVLAMDLTIPTDSEMDL